MRVIRYWHIAASKEAEVEGKTRTHHWQSLVRRASHSFILDHLQCLLTAQFAWIAIKPSLHLLRYPLESNYARCLSATLASLQLSNFLVFRLFLSPAHSLLRAIRYDAFHSTSYCGVVTADLWLMGWRNTLVAPPLCCSPVERKPLQA